MHGTREKMTVSSAYTGDAVLFFSLLTRAGIRSLPPRIHAEVFVVRYVYVYYTRQPPLLCALLCKNSGVIAYPRII